MQINKKNLPPVYIDLHYVVLRSDVVSATRRIPRRIASTEAALRCDVTSASAHSHSTAVANVGHGTARVHAQ